MTPISFIVQCRELGVATGRALCPLVAGAVAVVAVRVCDAGAQGPPQAPTHVSGKPSCASCVVRVDPVWRIAAVDGPASLTRRPRTIVRDSRGLFYVLADVLPQVFDAAGRFVRTQGYVGDGPGEFRAPWLMAIGRADSVTIADAGLSRLSVFDRDGRFVRSTPMLPTGRLWAGAFLASGDLVAVGGVGGVSQAIPIHVVGTNGKLVRSFGTLTTDAEGVAARVIAVDRQGSIWSVHRDRHQLDNFDSTGVLLASYAFDTEWFGTGNPNWEAKNGTDPPPPDSHGISVDDAGLVWLFTYVPRRDWNRALSPIGGGRAGFRFAADRAYATRIEVFDPANRTVLVSQTVQRFITHQLTGNLAAAYEVTEAGIPALSILRLTLTR